MGLGAWGPHQGTTNTPDCIFLIPSQVIITRVRPSIWLPALEFIWGALTGVIAACKTSKQIYGVRVLIGLAESSCYPGTVTMLSEWAKAGDMARWRGGGGAS